MAPLITKIKQNLHQKIQEKLVCSAAYLSVNTFVFKQESFHSEVMERSYFISGDNKIITPGKKSLFMQCFNFYMIKNRKIFHMVFYSFFLKKFNR